MNRYYLGKENVENQFQFYRFIQSILEICMKELGIKVYKLEKGFRKTLYARFTKSNVAGFYIQPCLINDDIKIVFVLKEDVGEKEFGSLIFEISKNDRLRK